MKIIVLNLTRETTKETVERLFKKHGKVDSCQLVMDEETGNSKGFGFIEMPDEKEAAAAIASLHGIKLDNHKIRVKISDQNK